MNKIEWLGEGKYKDKWVRKYEGVVPLSDILKNIHLGVKKGVYIYVTYQDQGNHLFKKFEEFRLDKSQPGRNSAITKARTPRTFVKHFLSCFGEEFDDENLSDEDAFKRLSEFLTNENENLDKVIVHFGTGDWAIKKEMQYKFNEAGMFSKTRKGVQGEIMKNKIKIAQLNSILEGVAGCGKTYYQKSLFEVSGENKDLGFTPDCSETVVFHPSTSYEDFVSGLRPQKGGGFSGEAGIFVELCNRAAADPENNYLLFIDEINRANTAKVFGDLLMVIEESKRAPVAKLNTYKRAVLTRGEAKSLGITTVRLQTAIDALPEKANPPAKGKEGALEYLAVPDNLYIVGTMNSTDRSVGTIDLALRRRFTWHTMEPKTLEELENEFEKERQSELSELFRWYAQANIKLQKKVGPDARLGHSYFYENKKTSQQIARDLLKQLAEIFYIFHLEDLIAEEPFSRPIQDLKLKNVGEGLGQKVIVEQVSANNSGKASGNPEPAESDSGKSPENPQGS
ncbi:AAA family ATPase [Rothia sp. SD9660Na]|uniref:McrB family protein n=1 Tax=Rothia sp. SD9660Na TaxID=3047030 RepID=UPI0024BB344E|nr:AAA family ATPase [Rothia sp. SD9660Na]WHS51263.1 AAA family ATPase [Rothia sp. SD9660Na]